MSPEFNKDTPLGRALRGWLEQLDSAHGDRASIRRCHDEDAVAYDPAFVRYFASCIRPACGGEKPRIRQFALILGLTSHLEADAVEVLSPKYFVARQMSLSRAGDSPKVSELRFRRVLQYNRDELYRPLLRVIRMMDGRVNLYDLASSLFYWGDSVKKRWAFDYFPYV